MDTTSTTALPVTAWLEAGRTADGVRLTDDRLRELFDLVDPTITGAPTWKAPIDVMVPKELASRDELRTAVAWYCGGRPDVEDADVCWHVTGAGYYAWCGA